MRQILENFKKEFSLVKALIILLIIAVGSYVFTITWHFIVKFTDLFIVLLTAWLLSFLLEPLVTTVSQYSKINKAWATVVVYLFILILFGLIIFLFIPEVSSQIQALSLLYPTYLKPYPLITERIESIVNSLLNNSLLLLSSVAQFFFYTFIVLTLSFYFIVDKKKIEKEAFSLVPKKYTTHIRFVEEVVKDTFSSFLQIQLFFAISMGVLSWIILTILQIEFTASASFLATLLTLVPVIGPIIGAVPPIFVAFISSPTKAIIVAVFILLTQQIIFNVIGTKLMGKVLKIHPTIVLLSLFIGLKIGGSVGALLAVPLIGILAVIVKRVGHHFLEYKDS